LRWIRTPLWNSWWGYAHLFWKPLTCALFFNKNDFYSIDIFHYHHFNFANIVNYFQFSLEYKNYLLLALLFLYFFMHLSEILLLSIIISYRKLTWPSPFFLFSPRLPFRCQESYSDSHYTRQLDFPAMSLIPHDIVLTGSLALVLSNDVFVHAVSTLLHIQPNAFPSYISPFRYGEIPLSWYLTVAHPPFRICHWIVLIPTSSSMTFRAKRVTLTFSVAKLVQAVFCKYQVPYSSNFFKNFLPSVPANKNFSWPRGEIIRKFLAYHTSLANSDSNVKNKCFTSKNSKKWKRSRTISQ